MIASKITPISILWIDDNPVDELKDMFYDNGFSVHIKLYYEDAIAWLNNPGLRDICDAVIMDVNSKTNAEQKQPSMDSFTDNLCKIYNLCNKPDKSIPWFVLTMGTGFDGATSLERVIPNVEWAKKKYYVKTNEKDLQSLIDHIREQTKDAPNRKLRNRYPGIWGCCDDKTEVALFKVIKGMEENHIHDTSLFIDMRMILGATVTYGKACGLLPESVLKANEAKTVLTALAMSDEDLVPSYISYNYAALCDTVNNGCHPEDENPKHLKVHPDVSNGKAPYLMETAFNQLLTVLNWFSSRYTAEGRVLETKTKVKKILSEREQTKSNARGGDKQSIDEGVIKEYKNGRYIQYYVASKQIYELKVDKGSALPAGKVARILASSENKFPFDTPDGKVTQVVFNNQYEIKN